MAAIVIYRQPINRRSAIVCDAMLAGIRHAGDHAVTMVQAAQYVEPIHDVAVFYGLQGRLTGAMADYSRDPNRRAVYIDLGYFGRRDGGKLLGFHKISVDARHPTAYFQNRRHRDARIKQFRLDVRPWREPTQTGHIVLAGMGPKGASAEGHSPGHWEREAVKLIRRHSKREILYRPKPNWPGAQAIEGTTFTKPDSVPLADHLRGAHAIVSHHSNANVEAIVAGIPSFTLGGIATVMGLDDLTKIETPIMPEGREQWLNDLAYCQWNISEMAAGLPWLHMKAEGLIP